LPNERGEARLCGNGGDDRYRRKVRPVPPAIPRELLQSGHRDVGTDEEVGDEQEGFVSQERRFERDREPGERLWLRPIIFSA
jgi:hypothetical protein